MPPSPPASAPPLTMGVLWEWLRPDIWLLGGAVVAALAVAVANVQIPATLGLVYCRVGRWDREKERRRAGRMRSMLIDTYIYIYR